MANTVAVRRVLSLVNPENRPRADALCRAVNGWFAPPISVIRPISSQP